MDKRMSKRNINKIEKKALIIAAAEKLFLQKGFESTAIDNVAKEAGSTIRTLYQYFNSKEDLFFAVCLKSAKQMLSAFEEALDQGKDALEKIRLCNKTYYEFYIEHPDMFRLLNYKPDNKQNCKASPNCREIEELKALQFNRYKNIIETGKSDGSISTNLDTRMAVFFGFLSSISILQTIASIEKSFWDMQEIDEKDFIRFSFDLLADALK